MGEVQALLYMTELQLKRSGRTVNNLSLTNLLIGSHISQEISTFVLRQARIAPAETTYTAHQNMLESF